MNETAHSGKIAVVTGAAGGMGAAVGARLAAAHGHCFCAIWRQVDWSPSPPNFGQAVALRRS